MQDEEIFCCVLIQVSVLSCEFKAENTHKLPCRKCGIYHGSKHVKESLYAKVLSDGRNILHGRMKERGMHKTNVRAVQAFFKHFDVVGKFISKKFHHVGRPA